MMPDSVTKRVVIAGAGIAGLSIAWAIRQRDPGIDIVVLERSPRTGGNIRTEPIAGYLCEWGPDGFLDNAPATLALVHALGLDSRLLRSDDRARRRYIFRDGRLSEVPTSVGGFVRTPLLSTRGKLRIMCEPFASSRPVDDESILDFATRRIGKEAASAFVDPMVSGVFAGNAEALSLKACFPRMWQIEEDHGGLFRGLLATRRSRRADDSLGAPSGRLTSFVGGMSDLTDGLTRALGASIRTSAPVSAVRSRTTSTMPHSVPPRRRYAVVSTPAGTIDADALVLSGAAPESAGILRELDPVLAELLERIPSAPLAVACLGYDEAAILAQCSLDGFGFLVPRGQGVRILGALWETSIYQHRAPAGKALVRVMIGGARDPEAASLPEAALLQIVRKDLARTMGVSLVPKMVQLIRHTRGIPQYVKGHLARVHQIDTMLKAHPALFLAGNSYRGVSINSCIAESDGIAESVLRSIAAPQRADAISA